MDFNGVGMSSQISAIAFLERRWRAAGAQTYLRSPMGWVPCCHALAAHIQHAIDCGVSRAEGQCLAVVFPTDAPAEQVDHASGIDAMLDSMMAEDLK